MAIARAIVSDPTLLICDEPTGDLDRASAEEILGAAADAQPRPRQDDRDGDARSEGGRIRHAHAAPRQGQPRRTSRRTRDRRRPAMKYFHLIWAALFRSKTRTFLTLFSVMTAFLLFGMLDSVRVAFNSGGSVDRRQPPDRVLAPVADADAALQPRSRRSARSPGVKKSSYAAWFGGIYQDPKNFFPNFSVGPDYLDLYPEYVIPADQRKAWEADRTGAVVGESLAKKLRLEDRRHDPAAGDDLPDQGQQRLAFKLAASSASTTRSGKGQRSSAAVPLELLRRVQRLRQGPRRLVHRAARRCEASADRVSKAIDTLSANSDHETKTQTEEAFNQAFIKQIADIGMIVTAIMGAVFFTLLLLTGNTMAQAVRERIPELAVLKTIGFTNRSVLMLVLAESVLLVAIGAMHRPGARAAGDDRGDEGQRWLHPVAVRRCRPRAGSSGLVLMLVFGVLSGLLPALRAMRLNIVDALAGR